MAFVVPLPGFTMGECIGPYKKEISHKELFSDIFAIPGSGTRTQKMAQRKHQLFACLAP